MTTETKWVDKHTDYGFLHQVCLHAFPNQGIPEQIPVYSSSNYCVRWQDRSKTMDRAILGWYMYSNDENEQTNKGDPLRKLGVVDEHGNCKPKCSECQKVSNDETTVITASKTFRHRSKTGGTSGHTTKKKASVPKKNNDSEQKEGVKKRGRKRKRQEEEEEAEAEADGTEPPPPPSQKKSKRHVSFDSKESEGTERQRSTTSSSSSSSFWNDQEEEDEWYNTEETKSSATLFCLPTMRALLLCPHCRKYQNPTTVRKLGRTQCWSAAFVPERELKSVEFVCAYPSCRKVMITGALIEQSYGSWSLYLEQLRENTRNYLRMLRERYPHELPGFLREQDADLLSELAQESLPPLPPPSLQTELKNYAMRQGYDPEEFYQQLTFEEEEEEEEKNGFQLGTEHDRKESHTTTFVPESSVRNDEPRRVARLLYISYNPVGITSRVVRETHTDNGSTIQTQQAALGSVDVKHA